MHKSSEAQNSHTSIYIEGPALSPHYTEWLESCVAPELIQLNVQSLCGATPYEYLLYSPQISRRNDGRIRDADLKRYQHLESGGWWCNGLDPFNNWQPMLWGCFKPDHPRRTDEGKLIKYEHPPKTPTRAFFLRVPLLIWQRVASLYNVPLPDHIPLTHDGEALGFWPWVLEHPQIPLTLTEGAKKAGALLTLGVVAVALPGINSGYRAPKDIFGNLIGKKRLIPELQLFANQERPVYLCFDRDHRRKTIKAVHQAIGAIGRLFKRSGCPVNVIRWSVPKKGVDDLIAAYGPQAFHAAYQSAVGLHSWQTLSYSQLTYPVNVRLKQRYLGDLSLPKHAKLIGIKSPKGTGKTEALVKVASEAMDNGQWVLVITHRVQLGEELCRRLKVPYVTEVKQTSQGKLFGFGLCIDSLHPHSFAQFSAEHWTDGVVILDECEQVLWHMLNSSTCQSQRVSILSQFTQLITNVLSSDTGQVFACDADLSDVSLDYLQALAGLEVDPWIVVNDWQPELGWRVFHYKDKTPAGMVGALEAHVAAGGKPFICTSSQKPKGRFSTCTLEAHFQERFPDKKILRIDSESICDPNHPAFACVTHLNELLLSYDLVIASPSIETGVSIDLKGHFTSVWGIFQGVQAENSVRQFLARLRDPVDRHIWVAPYGIGKIGNGSSNIKSLLASQHKLVKANLALLKDADFDPDEIDDSFSPVSLRTWAKMAARINQGMIHYRASVLDGLLAEGHQIIDIQTPKEIVQCVSDALTELRDTQNQLEAEAIQAVPMPTSQEYQSLKDKRAKTCEQRRRERKYSLGLRYGVDVTAELVQKDEQGWHPQLLMHYYLSVGREYLPARDKKRVTQARELGKGHGIDGKDAVWLPDLNKSQLSAAVTLLDKLGILGLLDPDREFRGSDPDLQALAETLKVNPWGAKVILNVTVNQKDSVIAIVQMVLAKLGLKLSRVRQDGTGKRERVYRFIPPDDGREQIFAAWLARDLAAVQSVSEADAHPLQKTNQATHTPRPYTDEVTHTPYADTASGTHTPLTHTPGNNEYLDSQGCAETPESFLSHSKQEGEQLKETETAQSQARRFCDDLLSLTNAQQLQEALSHLSNAAQALISELLQLPEFWVSAMFYRQLLSS